MPTKSKRKTVSRGDLSGTGTTLTEAKADLNNRIDTALTGSYDPAIVTFGEYSIVVFRTPTGWEYKLFDKDRPLSPEGINRVSAGSILGNVSRDEAMAQAAAHVINLSPIDFHRDEEIPDWLKGEEKRRNILSCSRFQRAYRKAKELQPDGNTTSWGNWAGYHMNDPQFD